MMQNLASGQMNLHAVINPSCDPPAVQESFAIVNDKLTSISSMGRVLRWCAELFWRLNRFQWRIIC